jgi:hypothetical protein
MDNNRDRKVLLTLFILLFLLPRAWQLWSSERSLPDQPIQGADFDCDGKTDIGVWRPENGTWYILLSSRDWDRSNPLIRKWGSKGDTAVGNSDYEGDGKSDMAVWRPSDGTWYIILSSRDWSIGDPLIRQWGNVFPDER